MRINLDSSDQSSSCPIKETNATLTLDTEQNSTSETLSLETDIQSTLLLNKVLVDLDAGGGFTNEIGRASCRERVF